MNPFDLHGPAFLLFYIALSACVIGIVILLRRMFESGPVPRLTDPYQIAYLRGGSHQALRVAIIALVDRGLLKAEGELLTAEIGAVERVRRPIERKLLEGFAFPAAAFSVFSQPAPLEACRAFQTELTKQRLLPTRNQVFGRALCGLGAITCLWWVAYSKIDLALSRGRHNIGFLVFFALAVPIVVTLVLRSRRTVLGDRVLQDFETLFSRLRDRADEIPPGGATNELALLAAVFGLNALPAAAFLQAQALFPMAASRPQGLSTWGSSCGSACGHLSSCGSSGGSSCGSSCGGGCGGGCGGCGS